MTKSAQLTAPAQSTARGLGLVCFVVEKLANRSGGAERILIELANALAAEGRPVQILSYENRGKKPFYPLAFGVTHLNLRRPNRMRSRARRALDAIRRRLDDLPFYPFPFGRLAWLSRHGGFERALSRHLQAHAPDAAVAFMPPAIVALSRARAPAATRRIASIHNVPALDIASATRWDPNPLDLRRRREAMGSVDAITVLLPEFRDWFPEALRHKVVVTPNPVRSVAARPPRRRTSRARVVLCVGRLAQPKRIDILIDAWAELADAFPDWEARVFGIGPLEQELAARIAARGLEGKVRLMGHINNIAAQYASADILAHPAEYEGWGLAVSEALSHGVPAIGFADCPGVNHLIRHGDNGLLVPGDGDRPAGLAAALRRLMEDHALRAAMGAAGPASVADYAPDKVRQVWRALLAGDGGGSGGETGDGGLQPARRASESDAAREPA